MRSLDVNQFSAIQSPRIKIRAFLFADALNSLGAPDPFRVWDDLGDVVVAGNTYRGGILGQVPELSAQSDGSIRGMTVTLSGLPAAAVALVRGSTIAQRKVTLKLGIFDPDTHAIIGALIPHFDGVIDTYSITTPESGGLSVLSVQCESSSRALTIKSTLTRSQSSQSLRSATDTFFNYAGAQRDRTIYFGQKPPAAAVTGKQGARR